MITKTVAVVLLFFITFSLMFSVQSITVDRVASSGSGWLSGWTYRKSHNITGSISGEQFNYPIRLNVHYNNGADNNGEVYLAGKCCLDFGDIRFTDSTGASPLDYWIQQKTDGSLALCWVKMNHIQSSPSQTTIYMYYGNPNASTTSNKDWTFDLMSDFEDGTKQGWSISWSTHVTADGVTGDAGQGNYSRFGVRMYGSGYAGTGVFTDGFWYSLYLSAGTYRFEAFAKTSEQDSYFTPQDTSLLVNGYAVDNVSSPGTSWHGLNGNFTVSTSDNVRLDVTFQVLVQGLYNGVDSYLLDQVFVRRWCYPEPMHASWGTEQTSSDATPPQIFVMGWIPKAPYPLVNSSVPRQGEPVLVMANVSDEAGGSGLDTVELHYRVNGGEWANVSMTYSEDTWWNTTMPGQPGNSTVEFYVTATDNAGNTSATGIDSYVVNPFLLGDLNGDGKVDMKDIGAAARHFGDHYP